MKTKLSIEFHSAENSNLIEFLSMTIAKHNEGTSQIDLMSLIGYFKTFCARWGYSGVIKSTSNRIFLLLNDNLLMTITEKKIVGQLNEEIVSTENY